MVLEGKRKADEFAVVPTKKRNKHELAISNAKNKALSHVTRVRTSNLFAPIMLLEGHEGEIYTLEFHPEGQYLASSGFDRRICEQQVFLVCTNNRKSEITKYPVCLITDVWCVYGECENISAMSGHTGAIMELHFTPDGSQIFTASTDHTLGLWDIATGQRVKKFKGHTTFVNSVQGTRRGPQTLVSGGDDSTIRLWDIRKRNYITSMTSNYQVTAVAFSDTAEHIFSGGIDNEIKVWDMRKNEILYTMTGHTDTITGLSMSPDGSYLLSNAMDNTLRIWDVRPYAPQERCVKVFTGHQHNFEKNLLRCKWSVDGSKVSAGSADRFLYIWDTTTRRILYKLPGHNGSVNDMDFHPNEPVVVSGSSDKHIYMGEIE